MMRGGPARRAAPGAAAYRTLVLPGLVALVALTLAQSGAARAELLEVRQVAAGMECPECARALQLRVKALPGIDAADTSWNRRVLTAHLRRGNQITLEQIRALVVAQHFQVREAEIVVAGRLEQAAPAGPLLLRVPETGIRYRIDLGALTESARRLWHPRLLAAVGADVVLTARVPGGPDGGDPQLLWPLDLAIGTTGR